MGGADGLSIKLPSQTRAPVFLAVSLVFFLGSPTLPGLCSGLSPRYFNAVMASWLSGSWSLSSQNLGLPGVGGGTVEDGVIGTIVARLGFMFHPASSWGQDAKQAVFPGVKWGVRN